MQFASLPLKTQTSLYVCVFEEYFFMWTQNDLLPYSLPKMGQRISLPIQFWPFMCTFLQDIFKIGLFHLIAFDSFLQTDFRKYYSNLHFCQKCIRVYGHAALFPPCSFPIILLFPSPYWVRLEFSLNSICQMAFEFNSINVIHDI